MSHPQHQQQQGGQGVAPDPQRFMHSSVGLQNAEVVAVVVDELVASWRSVVAVPKTNNPLSVTHSTRSSLSFWLLDQFFLATRLPNPHQPLPVDPHNPNFAIHPYGEPVTDSVFLMAFAKVLFSDPVHTRFFLKPLFLFLHQSFNHNANRWILQTIFSQVHSSYLKNSSSLASSPPSSSSSSSPGSSSGGKSTLSYMIQSQSATGGNGAQTSDAVLSNESGRWLMYTDQGKTILSPLNLALLEILLAMTIADLEANYFGGSQLDLIEPESSSHDPLLHFISDSLNDASNDLVQIYILSVLSVFKTTLFSSLLLSSSSPFSLSSFVDLPKDTDEKKAHPEEGNEGKEKHEKVIALFQQKEVAIIIESLTKFLSDLSLTCKSRSRSFKLIDNLIPSLLILLAQPLPPLLNIISIPSVKHFSHKVHRLVSHLLLFSLPSPATLLDFASLNTSQNVALLTQFLHTTTMALFQNDTDHLVHPPCLQVLGPLRFLSNPIITLLKSTAIQQQMQERSLHHFRLLSKLFFLQMSTAPTFHLIEQFLSHPNSIASYTQNLLTRLLTQLSIDAPHPKRWLTLHFFQPILQMIDSGSRIAQNVLRFIFTDRVLSVHLFGPLISSTITQRSQYLLFLNDHDLIVRFSDYTELQEFFIILSRLGKETKDFVCLLCQQYSSRLLHNSSSLSALDRLEIFWGRSHALYSCYWMFDEDLRLLCDQQFRLFLTSTILLDTLSPSTSSKPTAGSLLFFQTCSEFYRLAWRTILLSGYRSMETPFSILLEHEEGLQKTLQEGGPESVNKSSNKHLDHIHASFRDVLHQILCFNNMIDDYQTKVHDLKAQMNSYTGPVSISSPSRQFAPGDLPICKNYQKRKNFRKTKAFKYAVEKPDSSIISQTLDLFLHFAHSSHSSFLRLLLDHRENTDPLTRSASFSTSPHPSLRLIVSLAAHPRCQTQIQLRVMQLIEITLDKIDLLFWTEKDIELFSTLLLTSSSDCNVLSDCISRVFSRLLHRLSDLSISRSEKALQLSFIPVFLLDQVLDMATSSSTSKASDHLEVDALFFSRPSAFDKGPASSLNNNNATSQLQLTQLQQHILQSQFFVNFRRLVDLFELSLIALLQSSFPSNDETQNEKTQRFGETVKRLADLVDQNVAVVSFHLVNTIHRTPDANFCLFSVAERLVRLLTISLQQKLFEAFAVLSQNLCPLLDRLLRLSSNIFVVGHKSPLAEAQFDSFRLAFSHFVDFARDFVSTSSSSSSSSSSSLDQVLLKASKTILSSS